MTQTKNEPQLSAEMEKRFDEEFPSIRPHWLIGDPYSLCYRMTGHEYDDRGFCKVCFNPSVERRSKMVSENMESEYLARIKGFLATALEEQRAKYFKQIDAIPTDSKDYGNGYIVYGLIGKDRVLAILNGKDDYEI